jgi:hypothetical protein
LQDPRTIYASSLIREIQRLEELLKSEKFTSRKKSYDFYFLVLPVTSALMVPFPLSYNRFATDCAKEVIAAEVLPEEGLSVSQPTKAIRPCERGNYSKN